MLKNHPSIYALVDAFRREQRKTENSILKLKTGIVYKRKPHYIILDERLKVILSSYNKNKFDEFYENVTLVLKY